MVVSRPSHLQAGRVETMVTVVGVLGLAGYRVRVVVSTQPFAGAHLLAQPASKGGFDSGRSFLAARLNRLREG